MTLKKHISVLSALLLFVVTVNTIQNKYCQLSCDYVVTTFTHTICDRQEEKCGPHTNCGPDFKIIQLTNEQRQYILDLHNDLRNRVAIGNETRGNQPSAANMNVLTYSNELEFIAQCWANTCNGNPLIHDHCRRTSEFEHVGQNLGYINSSSPEIDIDKSINELILLWYDEVAIFDRDWVNDTQDRGPNFKVGHYTQMIWADTAEIGCAITYYSSLLDNTTWYQIVLVCNYAPGGNYLGVPVYEVGEPASNCFIGYSSNDEYPGLCGLTKKVDGNEVDQRFDVFELELSYNSDNFKLNSSVL